jgi:16S rRNA processing protein RimM
MRLLALSENGARRELQVEDVWPHKGLVVLKFAGVDSIDDAELLAGCELQVPLAERAELPPGAQYISDLIGCTVFDQGREVGPVADVTFGAGEAPLLVVRRGSEELLLPLAEDFLEALDVAKKEIRMKLPEGMLEVNAPLSDEEKRAQGKK